MNAEAWIHVIQSKITLLNECFRWCIRMKTGPSIRLPEEIELRRSSDVQDLHPFSVGPKPQVHCMDQNKIWVWLSVHGSWVSDPRAWKYDASFWACLFIYVSLSKFSILKEFLRNRNLCFFFCYLSQGVWDARESQHIHGSVAHSSGNKACTSGKRWRIRTPDSQVRKFVLNPLIIA